MSRVPMDNLDSWMADGYAHDGKPFTGTGYRLWPSGQLRFEAEFVDGIECGKQRRWYESGQLAEELDLRNGALDGVHREWFENGALTVEETGKRGRVIVYQRWDERGSLVESRRDRDHVAAAYKRLLREWQANDDS